MKIETKESEIRNEIELFREEFRKCGWKNKSLFTLLKEERINERMLARYLDLLGQEIGIQTQKAKQKEFLKECKQLGVYANHKKDSQQLAWGDVAIRIEDLKVLATKHFGDDL